MNQMDYMLSHLRLNTNSDLSTWSEVEIIQSFALLPMPKVSFPEWIETLAIFAGVEEKEKEKKQPIQIDPFERLKRDHQNLFKAGIVHMGRPVEKEEEDEEKKSA